MSIKVMSWVWDHSAAEGLDRLVLLAIADNADDRGGNAWPSVETLRQKAKVSERTVQRAVRRLVSLGELQVKSRAGLNKVNVYQVVMTPRPAVTPSDGHPVTGPPPRGANETPVGVTEPGRGVTQSDSPRHTDTQSFPEPSTNRPEVLSSALAVARTDVDRICDHLADRIEANGGKRPNITKRWRDSGRLLMDVDGRTEDQIHRAIDWCQADEFWRANVLSMSKLRDKYEQLRLQAKRVTSRPSTTDQRVADAQSIVEMYEAQEESNAQG